MTGQISNLNSLTPEVCLLSTVYHQFLLSRVSSERPAPKEWILKKRKAYVLTWCNSCQRPVLCWPQLISHSLPCPGPKLLRVFLNTLLWTFTHIIFIFLEHFYSLSRQLLLIFQLKHHFPYSSPKIRLGPFLRFLGF